MSEPRDRGSADSGHDQKGQNDWVGLLSEDGRWRWDGQQWLPVDPPAPGQSPAPSHSDQAASQGEEASWPAPWGGIEESRHEPIMPADSAPPITRAALFGTPPVEPEAPAGGPAAKKKDKKQGSSGEGTWSDPPAPQPDPAPPRVPLAPPEFGLPPPAGPPPWQEQGGAPRPQDQSPPTWSEPPVPPAPRPARSEPQPALPPVTPPPESSGQLEPWGQGGSQPAAPSAPETPANALSADRVMPRQSPAPESGLRRMLYKVSRGHINMGPSQDDIRRRQLLALVRTRVTGCRRIAIISRKGGIGKTTTTLMLGHQFASVRGDRVVALDANPDAGSLADRVARETDATVTDVLRGGDRLMAYSGIRSLTSQAPSRLEVVASDNDPHITDALGEDDYRRVMDVLARHYSLVLCDTGTGILDSATRGILNMADQVVLCAAPSLDASRVSALTLDWLEQQGYTRLARDAVVAINAVRPNSLVELDLLEQYFERRCRAVVRVPWDPGLSAGAETTLEDLHPATRTAYLNLAAMVAAGFAR